MKTLYENGWKHYSIQFSAAHDPVSQPNKSGCLCFPLLLLEELFSKAGDEETIIPFQRSLSSNRTRAYATSWDSRIYEDYTILINTEKVIFIDFYMHGATLSQSGTQSGTFLRVRFRNLDQYTEDWETIEIELTARLIPSSVPIEKIRKLRSQLMQQYIFTLFTNLILDSYSSVTINGYMLFPRIWMVISDQPQERQLLSLKAHDSYMDCSHCSLPTRIQKRSQRPTQSF